MDHYDILRFGVIVPPGPTGAGPTGQALTAAGDMLHKIVPTRLSAEYAPLSTAPCMPIGGLTPTPGPGPTPGPAEPCGQTIVFTCAGAEHRFCSSTINTVWNAAGQPSDWELMAFLIAVMDAESGGVADAAGDCCPNPDLDCTNCITCANSDHSTTCCCSFGLYMLNHCVGQGMHMSCDQLLNASTNATQAMVALLSAWRQNKAAGHVGQDLYRRVAADSGHPGASNSLGAQQSRQRIADYTTCFLATPLTLPLATFSVAWPLRGAINADCAWHMANEGINALDINCSGGEAIVAAHTGIVTFAGWDGSYGNSVEIRDSAFGEYTTKYGHMEAPLLVNVGDHVMRGVTPIGHCDTTGSGAHPPTGPHLHFEVKHDGVYLCPCVYLEGGC